MVKRTIFSADPMMPPFPTHPDDTSDTTPGPSVPESEFASVPYDRLVVETTWDHAESVPGNDAALWRKDEFGAWIRRPDYGVRHSQFGWEICDLGTGRGAGGVTALRPMQWQNYLDQVAALTQSRITADGLRNVRKLI